MGTESKKMLVSAVVFCWTNPIVSLELLGVGTLFVMYPQPCLKTFLSPVVVCTAFFLSALLTLGHRQQHAKQRLILQERKQADDAVPLKFDGQRRAQEVDNPSDSMPSHREAEAEEPVAPPAYGDARAEASQEPRPRANRAKSVHFGGTETLIFEQVYPSDSEIDEEFEDNVLPTRLADSATSPDSSLSDRSEEELDYRIHDFFSLTGQSPWASFGHSNSSISEANSLGDFSPGLLYDPYHYRLHRHTSAEDEDDQSNSEEDESAVGLIGFSWAEQGKNDEDPFWVNFNAGDDDSQATSEDDNLIEITPEYYDSEMRAIQTARGCQPKISNSNSFIPEEDNLIEIDISGEKCLKAHEDDEKGCLDLESKESPAKLTHIHKDPMTPPLKQAPKVNYAAQIELVEEIITECKYEAETVRQSYSHSQRYTQTVQPK